MPTVNLVFPVLSRKRNRKKAKIQNRNLIEFDIVPPNSAAFLTSPSVKRISIVICSTLIVVTFRLINNVHTDIMSLLRLFTYTELM